ncbi:MAG TPA: FAD-dependent oxidoreductase [Methanomassiliicoccales archaeon]|nr:FAD-dependent oxidoreductase [Methanomassiliicoccales archaeon]
MVLGGGPAGLACAAELAERGISVALLERRESLGGRVQDLSCKGVVHCRQCDVCRTHRLRSQVLSSELISVHTSVELEQVERNNGRYRFDMVRPKDAIDLGRCSRCGKCVEACPTGAMTKVGGKIRLNRSACRSLQGLECERCVSVCPVGAIDLFGEEHLSVNGNALVVATGSLEFPASQERRLGWGEVPGVITSMELESFLEGKREADIGNGKKVAFILCVGSRSSKMGTPKCSSVCCKYSLRQALALKEKFPKLSITMFVMDWRGLGSEDSLLKELASTDVQVVRSRPAEIFAEDGRPMVRFAAGNDVMCQSYDSVVLSVGTVPDVGDDTLSQLAIPRDPFGDLREDNCSDRGIFLAGSCRGSRDIGHCVADGTMAAHRAVKHLEADHE